MMAAPPPLIIYSLSFFSCFGSLLALYHKTTLSLISGSQRIYRAFKEEGGVVDVCRATRRTNSTAVIDIVKTFDLDKAEVSIARQLGPIPTN